MIVWTQIFHEVGPKAKSRRKVVHDIKKVEKHCFRHCLDIFVALRWPHHVESSEESEVNFSTSSQ